MPQGHAFCMQVTFFYVECNSDRPLLRSTRKINHRNPSKASSRSGDDAHPNKRGKDRITPSNDSYRLHLLSGVRGGRAGLEQCKMPYITNKGEEEEARDPKVPSPLTRMSDREVSGTKFDPPKL